MSKPCPFCGCSDQPTLCFPNDAFGRPGLVFYYACPRPSCLAEGPFRGTAEEALAAWDHRAAPEFEDLVKRAGPLSTTAMISAEGPPPDLAAQAAAQGITLKLAWVPDLDAPGFKEELQRQIGQMEPLSGEDGLGGIPEYDEPLNAIQKMEQELREALPGVITELRKPSMPEGTWWLDGRYGARLVTVEWSPVRGFGVSEGEMNEAGYGEGPEEVFGIREKDLAMTYVFEILSPK